LDLLIFGGTFLFAVSGSFYFTSYTRATAENLVKDIFKIVKSDEAMNVPEHCLARLNVAKNILFENNYEYLL
jgi:hypothetical protein